MVAVLSPSRASDFMQCPLLYRFRVVDRLPEAASPATARGALVHAVLERLFDLPAPERTRAAAEVLLPVQWSRLTAERADLLDVLHAQSPARLQGWFDEALALLDRWFTLEDPTRLEPAGRELYLESDFDGLLLRGYLDRLDVAGDGRTRVVDYKTGRAPRAEHEASALFQVKFYGLMLWLTTGRVPTRLQLVYLGSGEVLAYDPDEHDLRAVGRKLKALWEAIARAASTGDFPPSPSRRCDWCHHRGLCPAWGGTPPPLPEHAAEIALDPGAAGDDEVHAGDIDEAGGR